MHKNLEKILRIIIIFWGIYLAVESFLYFFNVRLISVGNFWLPSASVYSRFTERILGSVFLFLLILLFEVQKDLNKYKNLIIISGFWTLFHGCLMIYLSFLHDYPKIYNGMPSLYVWLPLYNQYVFLEGVILIAYSIVVYFWVKK